MFGISGEAMFCHSCALIGLVFLFWCVYQLDPKHPERLAKLRQKCHELFHGDES